MTFPYEILRVPGVQALEKLAELQRSGQGFPVIIGSEDDFELLEENFDIADEEDTIEEMVAEARTTDALAWFQERAQERIDDEAEFFDDEDDEEDEQDDVEAQAEQEPNNHLSAHCDLRTRKPYPEVIIAVVPAPEAWLVPCYLRFGGWNDCPLPEQQAAVYKYWGEKYGATIACVSGDVVEMQVARPPTTFEDALALASEQYLFCADLVEQGTQTVEALAKTLLNGRVWYFWWD